MTTYPTGLSQTTYIDPNGRSVYAVDVYGDAAKTYFDAYGRVTEIYESIDDVETLTKAFFYQPADEFSDYFGVTAKHLDNLSAESNDRFLIAQFVKDKLGREIQTKTEGEVAGRQQWIVSGKVVFDEMGRISQRGMVVTV